MKIGIFAYAFPHPKSGYFPGLENVAFSLSKALSRKQDITVRVFTSFVNGGGERAKLDSMEIFRAKQGRIPFFWIDRLFFYLNTFKNHKRELSDCDVLIDAGSGCGSYLSILCRVLQKPTIIIYHHYEKVRELHSLREIPLKLTNQIMLRLTLLLDFSSKIVAVSEKTRNDLVNELGIAKNKVTVIPDGVDPDIFNPKEPETEEDCTLLFVGSLIKRKGVAYLVKALPLVKNEFKDVKLLIIGDGPEKQNLTDLSEELDVGDNVKFLGYVTREELVQAYKKASIFIFPTLLEGFGLVIVEAMATGTLVLASNIEPLRSIVNEEKLLFEPKNEQDIAEGAIEFLCDKSERDRYREKLVSEARKYDWNNIADNYMKLCQELL